VRYHLPIGEGEVRGCGHSGEVVFSFGRIYRRAAELFVRDFDFVLSRGGEHQLDVILADLVA
jgi:hypothetical protein